MRSEKTTGKLSEETKKELAMRETREDAKETLADECGRLLDDDELDGIAGGYDFQVHHYRYYSGPTGGESEQKPTVFQPVR